MKLCRLLKLSHAEFLARKKTILFSVLAAGIPLIILLTYSLAASGVERVFLEYSSRPTNGVVYLALVGNGSNTTKYVAENGGQVLHEITLEEMTRNDGETLHGIDMEEVAEGNGEVLREITADGVQTLTPMEIFQKYTGVTDAQMEMGPRGTLATGQHGFQPLDVLLNNVTSYYPPFMNDKDNLEMALTEKRVAIVKFPDVKLAHNYSEELIEHYSKTEYEEIFSNLLRTYSNFRSADKSNGILRGLILAVSAVILIGTYVYLLDQELRSMVIYRALGASNREMAMIALGYLLEVGVAIAVYAVGVSLVLCGIVSMLNAGYVLGLMEEFYGIAPKILCLMGWNVDLMWVILVVLGMAPVSLLLTIDQFSVKRLARRLKKE